jgi:hypothetical protein
MVKRQYEREIGEDSHFDRKKRRYSTSGEQSGHGHSVRMEYRRNVEAVVRSLM